MHLANRTKGGEKPRINQSRSRMRRRMRRGTRCRRIVVTTTTLEETDLPREMFFRPRATLRFGTEFRERDSV